MDHMDVWSDAGEREAGRRRGLAARTARLQVRQLRRAESRVSAEADLVTAAGWGDHLVLRERGIDAHWLATPLPDDEFRVCRARRDGGMKAGLLGNFQYAPNRDAYRLLVDSWLPWLRSIGCDVVVAGLGSDGLGVPPHGVEIIGRVADVNEFYSRITVTLAPVRLGGGIKVKVLESLARGIPVVGSQFSFDGFPPSIFSMVRACADDGSDLARVLEGPLPNVDPDSPDLDQYRMSRVSAHIAKLLTEFV